MHTADLESSVAVQVVSELPEVERRMVGGLTVFESRLPGLRYLQFAHPSNGSATRVEPTQDHVQLCDQLFPGSLEKGVIRRSRVQAVFLDPAAPAELDVELADSFLAAPLLSTA